MLRGTKERLKNGWSGMKPKKKKFIQAILMLPVVVVVRIGSAQGANGEGEPYGSGVATMMSVFLPLAPVTPKPEVAISANRQKAAILYQRLAGIRVPIDYDGLNQMEQLLNENKVFEAAQLATQDPNFYNITVRDFAALMSTREETLKAPLNDFVATIVGTTRDQLDARLLLSGNFYYKASAAAAPDVPQEMVRDLLLSNAHYAALERQDLPLAEVLERVDGQQIIGRQQAVVANPDPAGLLTSRGWMEAHAIAGTNRRLVEFTFREFLCIPIEQWADTSNPDAMVGRDVDRFPGGTNVKYQTTCKGCHSGMDSFRGAFAQVDFADDRIKHGQVLASGTGANQMLRTAGGISNKMNSNAEVFPDGYENTDTSWINQAIRGSNLKYFGWRGDIRGSGIKAFGTMVSNAKAFSRCMVKRVYSTVCKRDPVANESQLIVDTADAFEKNNYNLKWLFEQVASQSACLGQ